MFNNSRKQRNGRLLYSKLLWKGPVASGLVVVLLKLFEQMPEPKFPSPKLIIRSWVREFLGKRFVAYLGSKLNNMNPFT